MKCTNMQIKVIYSFKLKKNIQNNINIFIHYESFNIKYIYINVYIGPMGK
jgi:hypothetical protein